MLVYHGPGVQGWNSQLRPFDGCRARNVRKAALAGSLNSSEAGLVNGCGDDEHARAEQGGLVGLQGIKATPGRPNISAVLARVCQEHSADQEIGVVAAGAASVTWPSCRFSDAWKCVQVMPLFDGQVSQGTRMLFLSLEAALAAPASLCSAHTDLGS